MGLLKKPSSFASSYSTTANKTAMVAEQSVAGQLSLPTAMKKNNKLIRPEADRIACNIWNSLWSYWKWSLLAQCLNSIANKHKKVNRYFKLF